MEDDAAVTEPVTLDALAARIDALGRQMDWLCENLASLFGFVSSMSSQGGGIRGMLKALRTESPELTSVGTSEVPTNAKGR